MRAEDRYKERKRIQGTSLSTIHKKFFLRMIDIILINIANLAVLLFKFYFLIPEEYLQTYFKSGIFATVVMLIVFHIFNLYQSIWKYACLDELIYVVGSSEVGSFILFLVYNFILDIRFSKSYYILFMLLTISFVGGSRFMYRVLRRVKLVLSKDKLDRRRVLIIGGGETGSMAIKEMYNNPQIHKYPVAVIDDDLEKYRRKIHSVPVVGTRKDIDRVVQ